LGTVGFVKCRSFEVGGVIQNSSLLTPDDLFRDSQINELID
jgi:hypothetical protein